MPMNGAERHRQPNGCPQGTSGGEDQTGCTLHGKRHWLHVVSTERLTCYHLDAKRGREAMDRMDLLPHFKNLLIHDCLGAYFTLTNCLHGLCSAEHGKAFCDIRSMISSSRKQDRPILETLRSLLVAPTAPTALGHPSPKGHK